MFRSILSVLFCLTLAAPGFGQLREGAPKLVVLISVDQLRGDLPARYADRFEEDGLRRLMDRGAWYTNAHYQHTTTYTGSGHATVATGGNPREHGVIGNNWTDPKTGKAEYCVQDDDHRLIGAATRSGSGRSPENLLVETIGDALIDASGGASKVISISRKDRSAILMGGHKGKAFWYGGGTFITSDYYYDAYPAWVEQWNAGGHADVYGRFTWDLLQPESEYVSPDKREGELEHPVLGSTFPKSLKHLEGGALYGTLSSTPFSDELVVSFARTAIVAEELGQREATDLLAVGLSATDSIGHAWGPNSREQEDNLLRMDSLLADFFAYLDATVGEDAYVVALSADHGVDGLPQSGKMNYVNPVEIVGTAERVLDDRFGEDDYVMPPNSAYLYFTPAILEARPDEIDAMEDVVAEAVQAMEGIAHAIPRHDIAAGSLEDTPLMALVQRSFHPDLCGNVALIQEPYTHFVVSRPSMTATHGSPYEYDTFVPVMFYGPNIPAEQIERRTGPEAIAPSLAAMLGLDEPDGAVGEVLPEVVGDRLRTD